MAPRVLEVTWNTLTADRRMAGAVLAAGVAFRLFLMMLPLAVLTAAGLGLAGAEFGSEAPGQVARRYGFTYAVARTIASSSQQASRDSWFLLASGLILLLWTGNGVVGALRSAFSVVWRVEPGRRSSLTSRGSSLTSSMVIVVGLTAAVLLTIVSTAIGASASVAIEIAVSVFLFAGYFGVWLLVSLNLPHTSASWTSLVPGAILTAAGLTGLHMGTVLFAANRVARASQLYGSLGFVSTVMFWLFIAGRVMVGSAQLNAIMWRRSLEARAMESSGLHQN